MSFSKANMEKVLDDLLLKMVEQYCRIAEVIVKIAEMSERDDLTAELRGDEERRRSLDATTDRLMHGLRIKH